ncbi:MAG: TonB-dependent receptor domain-containing protein, partial [Bryobacteraceae bacterium]
MTFHKRGRRGAFIAIFAASVCFASAQNTAAFRGIVHDPQHRPIPHARVTIQGRSLTSNSEGEFKADKLNPGQYTVTISAPGFSPLQEQIHLTPSRNPIFHFQLQLGAITASVKVAASASTLNTEASTVRTNVSHAEILRTPGAGRTNSLAMITDFTPGAYMVHDMLHIRGGHQVNWYLDGIPLMNTSIAANVAPMINPKNVASLQVQRGGYSSQYGDRTYGLFNVVTPSGFGRNNEANLLVTGGNFYSTDDQLDVGGHTDRFAYYASIDGNRSDLGLATPVPQVLHDGDNGLGGFASLLFNATPKDQLRWILSTRSDDYQIPNTLEQQNAGIRDRDLERDDLLGFSWTHTFSESMLFRLTPYFHFNQAEYLGGPNDTPFILKDSDRSNYAGVRAAFEIHKASNSASVGFEAWGQHDNSFFGLTANPGAAVLNQRLIQWAKSEAGFAEDQYKPISWLTLDFGLRLTHYGGLVDENAADPRLGAAVRLPWLNWVFHGYYSYYYQPPPLNSLAGPSLQFALAQGYGFVPLHGERDIQHDFGLTIPLHGWAIDADRFHTSARNFLDHDVIGNSGMFIPLTDLGAIISGTEVTLRSPRLFHRAELRIAYSNQIAQGVGPITGGLLEFSDEGLFLLDHDQRNTASAVLSLNLPGHIWATPTYRFGSGFLNGDGPAHLPPHSTFGLAVGKNIGESWSVSLNATNLGDSRYLLDTS